jgi:hypothetical protein
MQTPSTLAEPVLFVGEPDARVGLVAEPAWPISVLAEVQPRRTANSSGQKWGILVENGSVFRLQAGAPKWFQD